MNEPLAFSGFAAGGVFLLAWTGGVVCWIAGLVVAVRLFPLVKKTDHELWGRLSWVGWGASPAMWKWLFRDSEAEPPEIRRRKRHLRRAVVAFLVLWATGFVAISLSFLLLRAAGALEPL
jgi:hypothetical protein